MSQERAEARLREFFDANIEKLMTEAAPPSLKATDGIPVTNFTKLLFKIFLAGYRIGHSDGTVESTTRTTPLGPGMEVH